MQNLPVFVILKILLYNRGEIPVYRRIFVHERIKVGLQAALNTELYKAEYLVRNYPEYKKCLLQINNLEVVKLANPNCTKDFDRLLRINNIEIIKLGLELGAKKFDNLLASNNMDIVKLGIKLGANNFNNCLWSENIEVVKLGIARGASKFDNCLYNNNIEVILFGLKLIYKN